MNQYSDTNRPRRGTARKIYAELVRAGYQVCDLHYNPNLWGRAGEDGWGTWACELWNGQKLECWCGITVGGDVYLQGTTAPYNVVRLTKKSS